MKFTKILVAIALCLLATGCACRTKKMGPDGDNIARAEPGDVLADVNFAFDSYALDNTAKSILGQNADWLKANPSARVQVEGHCDERGTNEYNMALGARRARAAMEYLRSLGVEEGRMSTVSYGEELPLDPRHNEEAWAKNRRAHFNVQ
ncbi:MAG: peptidoglycan-associated lipoprotein Pal [Bdellovibrionota bacterium]|nr:MAG: peptidoglycan-associated lipoprotein Pal [Bdellovibrionota bacterium]